MGVIDLRTLSPELQARYGVGRRSPWAWIWGALAVAVFAGAMAFVGVQLAAPKIDGKLLAWDDAADDHVLVTFEVARPDGETSYCVLRAQDSSRVDVGYAVAEIPAGEGYVQQTYPLRTIAPAFVVELLGCGPENPPARVLPPQFPPGVVPPDQPWTP